MALSEEQIERIRAYARALQGDPSAAPTQPLPAPSVPPQPGVTAGTPTQPLQTPPPVEPESQPQQNGSGKGKAVARTFLRHLGRWDNDLGGKVPTPGGIGWLLFALLFLLFAIVPFNGRSRLEWMWMALTGSASLPGPNTPGQSAAAAQQAIVNLPGVAGVVNPANWVQLPVGGINLPVFFPRQIVP